MTFKKLNEMVNFKLDTGNLAQINQIYIYQTLGKPIAFA